MSKQKTLLLGENFSTANSKLRKAILFKFVRMLNVDWCYRCGAKIENIDELSIEHKVAWQSADDPIKSFYDLDNIAFSHIKCNSGAAKKYIPPLAPCGMRSCYKRGCRCTNCVGANRKYIAEWRKKTGKH